MDMTKIPQGDELLTIELTVKELIALTGVRFNNNQSLKVSAHKKLNSALQQTMNKEASSERERYW